MKKVLAILLSVLMILCTVPMAFASSDYNRPKVAADDAATIDALSAEQIAGVILDWIDRQITGATADFQQFNQYVDITGMTVPSNLDGIIAYKDYVAKLGGDFEKLDMSALKTRSEAGSDIAFLESVFELMKTNASIFGTVFAWEGNADNQSVFDYGKVGEYIMSSDFETVEGYEEIRSFYKDYLLGNDIQAKFIKEIAREMNYTPAEGETFDRIIGNGLKAVLLKMFGSFLNADSKAAVNAYDTTDTTKDVYYFVKDFIYQLQLSNKGSIDEMLKPIVENLGTALNEVKTKAAKFLDNPPSLTIGHESNEAYASYTPSSTNKADYMPTIYANDQAKETMDQYASVDDVEVKKNSEMTDADKALVAGSAEAWGKYVKVKAAAGGEEFANMSIKLDDVEKAVIKTLEENVNGQGINTSLSGMNVTATISDAKATFSYKAYEDDDSFAVQVKIESATAKVNVTSPITASIDVDLMNPDAIVVDLGGMYSFANSMVQPMVISAVKTAVGDMFADPAFATVVINNLSGKIEGLEELSALLGYIENTVSYDNDLLDFFKDGRYDSKNGAIAQMNRVLVDAVDMFFTESGMSYLGVNESNDIDTNIKNLREKAGELINKAGDALEGLKNNEALKEIIGNIDLSAFDFSMLDAFDFSSNEALYVSVVKFAAELDLPAKYEKVAALLDELAAYDSLEGMFASILNDCIPAALAKLPEGLTDYTFTAITDYSEVGIVGKAVDMVYEIGADVLEFALSKVNSAIAKVAEGTALEGLEISLDYAEKGSTYEETLNNLVDRFFELASGIIRVADVGGSNPYARITPVLNAVLPMSSMLSNAGANGANGSVDVEYAKNVLFNDALNGNVASFLAMFEVKDDAIAGGVTIGKALINSSDHIVDAFFPNTVETEEYPDAANIQQTFTGAKSDVEIAARNMISLNNYKGEIIPAALNLVREAGVLPFFAAFEPCADDAHTWDDGEVTKSATCTAEGEMKYTCTTCYATKTEKLDKIAHTEEIIPAVAATCKATGLTEGKKCSVCDEILVAQKATEKLAHKETTIPGKNPTCSEAGLTEGKKCSVCGEILEAQKSIPALDHSDDNGDNICDTCGADLSTGSDNGGNFFSNIWARITGFFQRIFNWFKNLFK